MIHYIRYTMIFAISLILYGCPIATCKRQLDDRKDLDVNGIINRKYLQKLRPTPMLDIEIEGGEIVTISAPKVLDPGLWDKAREGGEIIKKKGSLTYIYIEDGEEFHFTFSCN